MKNPQPQQRFVPHFLSALLCRSPAAWPGDDRFPGKPGEKSIEGGIRATRRQRSGAFFRSRTDTTCPNCHFIRASHRGIGIRIGRERPHSTQCEGKHQAKGYCVGDICPLVRRFARNGINIGAWKHPGKTSKPQSLSAPSPKNSGNSSAAKCSALLNGPPPCERRCEKSSVHSVTPRPALPISVIRSANGRW